MYKTICISFNGSLHLSTSEEYNQTLVYVSSCIGLEIFLLNYSVRPPWLYVNPIQPRHISSVIYPNFGSLQYWRILKIIFSLIEIFKIVLNKKQKIIYTFQDLLWIQLSVNFVKVTNAAKLLCKMFLGKCIRIERQGWHYWHQDEAKDIVSTPRRGSVILYQDQLVIFLSGVARTRTWNGHIDMACPL